MGRWKARGGVWGGVVVSGLLRGREGGVIAVATTAMPLPNEERGSGRARDSIPRRRFIILLKRRSASQRCVRVAL